MKNKEVERNVSYMNKMCQFIAFADCHGTSWMREGVLWFAVLDAMSGTASCV